MIPIILDRSRADSTLAQHPPHTGVRGNGRVGLGRYRRSAGVVMKVIDVLSRYLATAARSNRQGSGSEALRKDEAIPCC